MAEEPTPLAHAGAWTEDTYLALETAGRHIELIDGSLLVGPVPDERHAHAVAVVRAAVQAALPDGLEVTGPVALRLSPGRILVPDLVVVARPGPDVDTGAVRDSSVALAVIDVVGAGNGVADRWFKPQLYAGSRIPYALLVDHEAPFAVGSMLIGGRYHEYAAAEGDGVLRLDEPFALELGLAALAAPAGPDGSSPDGSPPDGSPPDGSPPDGSPPDGSAADGSAGGGSAGLGPAPDGPDPDGSAGVGPAGVDPVPVDPAARPAGPGAADSAGESPARGSADSSLVGPAGGQPAADPSSSEERGAARSARGFDAAEARSGTGGNGARVNGAEGGTSHDGATAGSGPHRSHPDEDHSVHA